MGEMKDTPEARRQAVADARAIGAFAGVEVTPEMDAVLDRFARGEITEDEVVAEARRLAR